MSAEIAAVRQQISDLESRSRPAPAPTTAAPSPAQALVATKRLRATARAWRGSTTGRSTRRCRGSWRFPGTPARVKLDGYAKLDAIVDSKPAGNPDQFVPGTIPVGLTGRAGRRARRCTCARRGSTSTSAVRPSFGSDFRTFAEIDFYGTSGPVDPRMRHFYGQLANVLIGQTWTTFTDVDAFPDTLDIAGRRWACRSLRQAQVRYTQPLRGAAESRLRHRAAAHAGAAIRMAAVRYSPAPDCDRQVSPRREPRPPAGGHALPIARLSRVERQEHDHARHRRQYQRRLEGHDAGPPDRLCRLRARHRPLHRQPGGQNADLDRDDDRHRT